MSALLHFSIKGDFYAEDIDAAIARLAEHFDLVSRGQVDSPFLGTPYTFDVSPIPDDAP